MTDLKDMTEDELDDHRREVLKEIDRREKLDSIPKEIAKLRSEFESAGGDPDDLADVDEDDNEGDKDV